MRTLAKLLGYLSLLFSFLIPVGHAGESASLNNGSKDAGKTPPESIISNNPVAIAMEANQNIHRLYGPFADLAIEKMASVNSDWANLVNLHAFSDQNWGLPWADNNLAMTDKEVVTLSGLISSGLANQTALHIHGFLGSGGKLNELAALMHAAWRPRESAIDSAFIDRIAKELEGDGLRNEDLENFISELRAPKISSEEMNASSALPGFTRMQLSELVSTLAAGRAEWNLLKKHLHDAELRGASNREIELILRHAEIYLGESAAIEGAQAWMEVNAGNDGRLKNAYLQNVRENYPETQFYEWLNPSQADPFVEPLFDMALTLASNRFVTFEPRLKEILALKGSLTPKDNKMVAFVVIKATQYRSGSYEFFKEYLEGLANSPSTEPSIRVAILAIVKEAKAAVGEPVQPTSMQSSLLSYADLVSLASLMANCHTHPKEFEVELKSVSKRGLDHEIFQRLANRSTRIVGYPVAMNAYLAFKDASQ